LKTIIHIDDDLDDLALFQEAITRLYPAYVVASFSDSKTALSFLEETTTIPGIIFLDINMPKQNGKETLLLIRRNKKLAGVPVVMYSSTIYGADKDIYLKLGANEFLKKANTDDGMIQEIDQLLLKFLKYDINEFYNEQKNNIR
jgi:CheY-like chemotaxis protein